MPTLGEANRIKTLLSLTPACVTYWVLASDIHSFSLVQGF
ncbi:hypothetical protein TR2A62_0540 [Thalassobium sp. R2A62]|nr:hypothetical protein TR2A62_0540 [Thalassobium sp. R2A62]